jgi:hypothetical protein
MYCFFLVCTNKVDLAGIAREGWEREVTAAFVSHLEEMLQHGRAASLAQGRMVGDMNSLPCPACLAVFL